MGTENSTGALGRVAIAAGVVFGLIPGASFFTDYAPPHFPAIALLTTLGALWAVWTGWHSPPDPEVPFRRAGRLIIVGLVLSTIYVFAYQTTTFLSPAGERFQIGFAMEPWSLTERAREFVATHPDVSSPALLALSMKCYVPDEPDMHIVWTTWSIWVAGLFLVFTFCATFLTWAYAFGAAARATHQSKIVQELVERENSS